MPKIVSAAQAYRQTSGNHTIWQDKRQGNQKHQDNRIHKLARQPGLHAGNAHRQNVSNAMVQLLAILTAAQTNSMTTLAHLKNTDTSMLKNKMQVTPSNSQYQVNKYIPVQSQKYTQSSSLMTPLSSYQKKLPNAPLKKINGIHSVLARKKRSLISSENIPAEIFTVMTDHRYDFHLRNTLDIIFRLAQKAPEVRYATDDDKNLFLLLKCIQQMHFFIKINNHSAQGKEMLSALLDIANDLDSPSEKELIDSFKEQFISENAVNRIIRMQNSTLPDISQKMNLVGDVIAFSPRDQARIIFGEQTKFLKNLLKANRYISNTSGPLSFTEVNHLVDYLSGVNVKERSNEVALILLSALRKYNSYKEGSLSDEQKMAIIAGYLNHAILGMSLNEWCVNQLKAINSYDYMKVDNEYLQVELNSFIDRSTNEGKLSRKAIEFYQEKVLKKILPTFALPLNIEGSDELYGLDITAPRWGFIHAGAMLLQESGVMLEGLALSDIEDTGMTLNTMLRQGAVPQKYIEYFRLPALLCYAKAIYISDLSMLTAEDMQQVFLRYFEYVQFWENKHNPLVQLPTLMHGWKTRGELARVLLRDYGMGNEWLNSYLNSHSEMDVNGKLLPNIDKVFEEQNLKLADAAYATDELLLPQVFNTLNEGEQKFIEKSKVDRVRAQFNARDSINKIPMSPHMRMGLVHAGALIYRLPDRIDLLQCTLNDEERIYALEISRDANKYTLKRVDRDRQAMLQLLDDSSVPSRDSDYKLRVSSHYTLKRQTDRPQQLIKNLAALHRKKLLTELEANGYDKTTQEKVTDFLLGLLPFYTCISESIKGNKEEAIPACIVDVASLLPFAGKAIHTGIRFSTALGGTTLMALRYGMRQATIKEMLKQTGKELIKHSPFIAEEISPQLLGLGSELLSDLDPGFGLFAAGGAQGIRAMEAILTKMTHKSLGMVRLLDMLKKNNAQQLLDPLKGKPKIESLYSSAHSKVLDVAIIGAEKGRQIWSQINPETGAFFGDKFIRNADNLELVQVRLRHKKPGPEMIKGNSKEPAPEDKPSGSQAEDDVVKEIKVRISGIFYSGSVLKRHIADSNYIQYYTKFPVKGKNSEILVISAHGGFMEIGDGADNDMLTPPVILPSDITLKFLTPHRTTLNDPGLGNVVNAGKNLRAYVTITNKKITNVDFVSQKGNPEWYYPDDYDPKNIFNTLGRKDGLQNYRHVRYEGESDKLICKVLIKNRKLAEEGKTLLADVLTVDYKISSLWESSLKAASIQKVLDLDKAGKLLNENGKRYKTIVFSHCRNNFFEAEEITSSYFMNPLQLEAYSAGPAPKGSTISDIIMTHLYRDDANKEFAIKHYNVGRFIFRRVSRNAQSTSTATTASSTPVS